MGIIKRDSITITILSYVGVVVGYVNKMLLLPNFFTETQVGLTTILISLGLMYAQFASVGINSTIIKFFPFFRTSDKRNNGLFFWSAMGISAGFVLFTTLFIIFKEPVINYFAPKAPLLSKYYLLLIPLGLTTLFYNFYSTWLQSLHKTVISSVVYDLLLRLLLTAAILIYAFDLVNFEQFIIGYVLIHFVPTLILLIYTAAIGESYIKPIVNNRTKRLLSLAAVYGLWQFMGGASQFIIPVVDQTMLSGILGLAEGGIFAVITYMVSAMIIPYRSIIKVATPIVSKMWKERDMEGMQSIYRSTSQMCLIVGCFFFLMIWINLDNIFSLIPESYSAGRYVFLFMGLGRVFDMYTGLNGTILVTSKKYRYDFAFSIFLVLFTIATNLYLIPRMGITGAAIATMTTVIIYCMLRVGFVWHFYKIQPFALKDIIVVGVMILGMALSWKIPYMGNIFIDLPIRSAVIGVIFGLSIYIFKLSAEVNNIINYVIKSVVKKLKIQ